MKTIEDVIKAWNLAPLPTRSFNMVRAYRPKYKEHVVLAVCGTTRDGSIIGCRKGAILDSLRIYQLQWSDERNEYVAYGC